MNTALNRFLVATVAIAALASSTTRGLAQSLEPGRAYAAGEGRAGSSAVGNPQIAFLQLGAVAMQRQKADAMNLFQAMQFGLAADAYKKICVAEPNLGSNHYWLAESLYEQCQFAAASVEFSRAAALDPQNEKALVRLAESFVAARSYSQAKDAALQAMPNVHDERLRGRLTSVMRVALRGAPASANLAARSQNQVESRRTK